MDRKKWFLLSWFMFGWVAACCLGVLLMLFMIGFQGVFIGVEENIFILSLEIIFVFCAVCFSFYNGYVVFKEFLRS